MHAFDRETERRQMLTARARSNRVRCALKVAPSQLHMFRPRFGSFAAYSANNIIFSGHSVYTLRDSICTDRSSIGTHTVTCTNKSTNTVTLLSVVSKLERHKFLGVDILHGDIILS